MGLTVGSRMSAAPNLILRGECVDVIFGFVVHRYDLKRQETRRG